MKKITVIIAILFAVLLYSCKREVDCPGFPEEDRDWAPYGLGDTIKLLGDKDTISFVVSIFEISEVYSTVYSTIMGNREDCECEKPLMEIWSIDSSYFEEIRLFLRFAHTGKKLNLLTSIHFFENSLDNGIADIFLFTEENRLYEDTVSINGKDYYGAITIDEYLDRNEKYAQVKIVKGLGLYEITEKSGKVWRLEIKE